jgi:lactoylglutathione lyase
MTTEGRARLGAAGIGVSNLERSVDFYTRVFGMRSLFTLHLPDMDEVILGFKDQQAGLVLMQHKDPAGHDYAATGGKLVFYVADPSAVAAAVRDDGLDVVREPTPVPELGDAIVGFVRDPDGHLLELLQA